MGLIFRITVERSGARSNYEAEDSLARSRAREHVFSLSLLPIFSFPLAAHLRQVPPRTRVGNSRAYGPHAAERFGPFKTYHFAVCVPDRARRSIRRSRKVYRSNARFRVFSIDIICSPQTFTSIT